MLQHRQATQAHINYAVATRGQRRCRDSSAAGRRDRPTRPKTVLIVAAAFLAVSTLGLSPSSALAAPATGRLSRR